MSLHVRRITPAEARKLGIPEVVTVIAPVPKRKKVDEKTPGPTDTTKAPEEKEPR